MDQDNIDWSIYLTDDVWYLPEPLPAGAESDTQLIQSTAALESAFEPEMRLLDTEDCPNGSKEALICPKHAGDSSDCCWRFARNDPFAGYEERIAVLGHFGMGFPENQLPEYVEGWFTKTHVELGQASILNSSILDTESSGSNTHCATETQATAPREDEAHNTQLLVARGSTENLQQPDTSNIAGVTTENATQSPQRSPEQSSTFHDQQWNQFNVVGPEHPPPGPTTMAATECPAQHDIAEYEALKYLEEASRHSPEGDRDWAPAPPVPMARGPYKKGRKRKNQNLSDEFIRDEQNDSDSDYEPDQLKKKPPRTAPTTHRAHQRPAKQPRVHKVKQSWSTAKRKAPRLSQQRPEKPREFSRGSDNGHVKMPDFAPKANKAHSPVPPNAPALRSARPSSAQSTISLTATWKKRGVP